MRHAFLDVRETAFVVKLLGKGPGASRASKHSVSQTFRFRPVQYVTIPILPARAIYVCFIVGRDCEILMRQDRQELS